MGSPSPTRVMPLHCKSLPQLQLLISARSPPVPFILDAGNFRGLLLHAIFFSMRVPPAMWQRTHPVSQKHFQVVFSRFHIHFAKQKDGPALQFLIDRWGTKDKEEFNTLPTQVSAGLGARAKIRPSITNPVTCAGDSLLGAALWV